MLSTQSKPHHYPRYLQGYSKRKSVRRRNIWVYNNFNMTKHDFENKYGLQHWKCILTYNILIYSVLKVVKRLLTSTTFRAMYLFCLRFSFYSDISKNTNSINLIFVSLSQTNYIRPEENVILTTVELNLNLCPRRAQTSQQWAFKF